MTKIGLQDRHRFSLRVGGRRIPSEAWVSLREVDRIISEANTLWRQAQEDAKALRKSARQEGLAAGRCEGQAQMAEYLVDAQREARDYLARSEERIIDLALAVLTRIAPHLDCALLLRDLVTEAVRSAHMQDYLLVRVHPDAVAVVSERLETWCRSDPMIRRAQVVGDDSLEPLGVAVETEAGTVHAGYAEQLRAVGAALRSVIEVSRT